MINVVPVGDLCDQHLLSEQRATARYPFMLLSGRLRFTPSDRPSEYSPTKGNLSFFTDKLRWVFYRNQELIYEATARRFDVVSNWPKEGVLLLSSWNDWHPSLRDIRLNKQEIAKRLPAKAVWSRSIH